MSLVRQVDPRLKVVDEKEGSAERRGVRIVPLIGKIQNTNMTGFNISSLYFLFMFDCLSFLQLFLCDGLHLSYA